MSVSANSTEMAFNTTDRTKNLWMHLLFLSPCFKLAVTSNTYPWNYSSMNPVWEPWRNQGTYPKATSAPSHNGSVNNLLDCCLYQCSVDPTHIHCKWQTGLTHLKHTEVWLTSWKKSILKIYTIQLPANFITWMKDKSQFGRSCQVQY